MNFLHTLEYISYKFQILDFSIETLKGKNRVKIDFFSGTKVQITRLHVKIESKTIPQLQKHM